MTITTKIFGNLQTGVPRADDLRVRTPINAALQWLGEGLVNELNTHFGAVSQSISVRIASLLASNNAWTGSNQFFGQLTAVSSISSAGGAPYVIAARRSPDPAANDIIGGFLMQGRNAAAADKSYFYIDGQILNPATGSESSAARFVCQVNGVDTVAMNVGNGVLVGPAGSYQGAGTINTSGPIYRSNTQVVNTRVTGYGDPFGAVSRATISVTTVTTAALAAFVAAMYTDLKAHGLIGN
jgi:hypothetical protein